MVQAHPWDKAAAGWNSHAVAIRTWLRGATQAMLDAAQVQAGARVLDIAAGAGDQSLDIAQRVGQHGLVLATDISPGILALAKANAMAAGYPQVNTQLADAQSLGLAGANFDAAVSRLGLMFCREPQRAFQQAHAALKPNGRLAALVFAQPQHNPCLVISIATARKHAGLPPLSLDRPGDYCEPGSLMSLGQPALLASLLADAGFVNVKVGPVAAPFGLPSAQHYIDFLRSAASPLMVMLAQLSVPAQQAAWDDMVEQLSQFNTSDGWVGPNELLLCSARAP